MATFFYRKGSKLKTIGLAALVLVVLVVIYLRRAPYDMSEFQTAVDDQVSSSLFTYTLSKTADSNNNVILAFVDYGYLDMGVNLYLSSFKPLGLKNHLFLGSDDEVCPSFKRIAPEVNCVQVTVDKESRDATKFASRGFARKNWRKLKVVYQVLQLGFHVLLMDLDIVLFKDPFLFFERCPMCDIQIQNDHVWVCGGFYMVRATKTSLELFRRTWSVLHDFITGETRMKRGDFNEQAVLDKNLHDMNGSVKDFKPLILPESQFGNGNSYFMSKKLMFATDEPYPPDMYIVHNNWIVSEPAKKYRFREHFMWHYDKDGYYSDPNRKYLQYGNPLDVKQVGEGNVHELEKEALQAALTLGFLLNRTVILPSFSCAGCTPSTSCHPPESDRCSLIAVFKARSLDRYFENLYRESTFLTNHMVPNKVKTSISKTVVIESTFFKKYESFYELKSDSVDRYQPSDSSTGASNVEILKWFAKYQYVSVLNLHNLYKTVKMVPDSDFNYRIRQGVVLDVGNYMQGGPG